MWILCLIFSEPSERFRRHNEHRLTSDRNGVKHEGGVTRKANYRGKKLIILFNNTQLAKIYYCVAAVDHMKQTALSTHRLL
jgi:hypothetical protein